MPAGDVRVVAESEWDALVTRLHGRDTYTLAAYHRVSTLLEVEGTRPVLLHFVHRGGEIALPLLLRPLPDGVGWDATSAYGYGGPVGNAEGGGAAFGIALDGWARANGVVTTFLRQHPMLDNAGLVPPAAELVPAGATVAWDVSAGRDVQATMHAHHRRAARRAERAGLEVVVDPHPTSLADFGDLYYATMQRLHADDFFFFPKEYWPALLAEAGTLQPVIVEGYLGGELIAALLCFRAGPWLHYHLGASGDAARSIGASNRLFLEGARWAQSNGMDRFHLGGGVGGSATSSLFVFKHRYDPESTPRTFHVAKLVHDRQRYRELAGTDGTTGFFPPWRGGA